MSEPVSWSDTPAGALANGGWTPEDRAVELAARQAERARDRAEFEARLAADPEWSAVRSLQEALRDRGWTGNIIEIGHTGPPELQPLFAARQAAQARTGTWGPGANGSMQPTNDVAAAIEQAGRERYEAAKLRQRVANQGLPPGLEGM